MYFILVNANAPGSGDIEVFETITATGCVGPTRSFNVTVSPSVPSTTVTGPTDVCRDESGTFIVLPNNPGSTYSWSLPPGAFITSDPALNTVDVTFPLVVTGQVSAFETNGACSVFHPGAPVTVRPLPTPAITGDATACVTSTGNIYTTEPGMSNYIWTVSAGGSITGGAGSNSITVDWNTAGAQTISVNYDSPFGCTAASPTVKAVAVYPLPVPTITGNASACLNSTGNLYATEVSMTNYSWSVTGGTITAGAGTNLISVTWNSTGPQTVSVNYTNGNNCTAALPTEKIVTVNPLPAPTITGPNSVCLNSTGNVYETETGMSNYVWVVSAGGTITAGGTGNESVTVTWTSTGAKTVSVNYTNGDGCTAAAPTAYNVTVNPLPVPTISGNASACITSTGNVYTTEVGMTAYTWNVSAGGTITAGGGVNDNSVTITWNTAGAQSVSVNYINGNGCTAASPTVYPVTVNPLPVPTITGNASVCQNSTGNVYSTEAGMTAYTWAVSVGGTVTGGGGVNDNTVTISWGTTGPQSVSVIYTNGNGCTAPAATVYPVTVNVLPVPTITGPAPVCRNEPGNVYTTEASMTNYIWTVSAGGIITAGGNGTNSVTITWTVAGAQSVSVNYNDANGCTAATPTSYPVTVNALPVPAIAGPAAACITSTGNVYSTVAGMTNYIWTVSAGGTITAGGGAGDETVTVTWNSTGAQTVSLNYTDLNGCTAASPTSYSVIVNPLPVPTITGNSAACEASTGNIYTTEASMTNYLWNISAGGTVTAGGTPADNSVTVTWITPGPQTVSVNYTNGNGCTAASATVKPVTVNPLPVPTISGPAAICQNSTGNIYTTEIGMANYIWTVSAGGTVTSGGGIGNNAVVVTWNTTGPQTVSVVYTNGNGCTAASATVYPVNVNVLPVPTITGPTPICANITGNTYSTEASMTNYLWTVSPGGTITAGGTINDNTVTVTWTIPGPRTVSVNYTNSNGCTATIPTVYNSNS